MNNNFIKQTVERLLDLEREKVYSPGQFVHDWHIAGKALRTLNNLDYTIEIAKNYDNTFTVAAQRWVDGDLYDYAFSSGESTPRCIMETLIKVSNNE